CRSAHSKQHERWIASPSSRGQQVGDYSNSNSILFVSGSSLAMRNLRICPARIASGFSSAAGGPLFQRACSIEPNDDRLGLDDEEDDGGSARLSSFASRSSGIRHVATTPSPSSTRALPSETSIMRPVTMSPSLCSARYSSKPVGTSCF